MFRVNVLGNYGGDLGVANGNITTGFAVRVSFYHGEVSLFTGYYFYISIIFNFKN